MDTRVFMDKFEIVLTVILFLLIIAGSLTLYFMYYNTFIKEDLGTPQNCPVGTCKIDKKTGERDCQNLTFYNGTHVCTEIGACTHSPYDCIRQSDESTLCRGEFGYTPLCPAGNNNCNCYDAKYCPAFSHIWFQQQLDSTGLFSNYIQNDSWYNPEEKLNRSDVPIRLGFNNSSLRQKFCGITDADKLTVFPSTCIRGEWIRNTSDNLWYCGFPEIQGSKPGERSCENYAIRNIDGTYRCS